MFLLSRKFYQSEVYDSPIMYYIFSRMLFCFDDERSKGMSQTYAKIVRKGNSDRARFDMTGSKVGMPLFNGIPLSRKTT